MQRKISILVLLAVSAVFSVSAQVYHVPEQNGYGQRVSTMPTTQEFRSTSSYQSNSSLSGNYTVPFAAGDAAEIGASSPTGGPRKAPPSIGGGEGNKPVLPGYNNQPLTDGVGALLLAALVYAMVIIRRKNALVKE
jgi:hypothetical protein